jgi:hypothetical protein
MEYNIDTTTEFGKLVHRMNRAYGCFLIWKYIRKSISLPECGQREAERRASIMNLYGGIFTGILYAVESTFITDLHKFFDKQRSSLKLHTLMQKLPEVDKKEAELLLDTVEEEVERIENLRHNFTAHEPKTPEVEKIFILEIEKIFSTVQQVLNIISRSNGGSFITWALWESDNEGSFTRLLGDLELGYHARMQELDKDL